MKELMSYGSAGREVLPKLRESIEAAKDHPVLRSFAE